MRAESSITNRALLVSIGISQWDARKMDKPETNAVQTKHGMTRKAARVHKSLLPGCKELDAVHKYSTDIRAFLYKNSLPWADGVQIIRTSAFIEFTQRIEAMRSRWHELVNEFVELYPQRVKDAKFSLGTMYDLTDYPQKFELREKFSIDVRYMPVPDAADWRVDVGDDALSSLRESIERQVRDSQGVAMKEAWSRLYNVVEKAHERLSQPSAVFRDSLIENAVELCDMLPSLNIANDPELERMRQTIENTLCAHAPRTLRVNAAERNKTAVALKAAMGKMSAMYGGM